MVLFSLSEHSDFIQLQGVIMGRIKQLLIDSNEHDRQAIEALKPKVHVLTCNERPVGVYVDRMTAEYEMHLCIQGDVDELGSCSDYAVHTFNLSTHRLD
jgi:hypothetical protein